jgi:hypothetical protein
MSTHKLYFIESADYPEARDHLLVIAEGPQQAVDRAQDFWVDGKVPGYIYELPDTASIAAQAVAAHTLYGMVQWNVEWDRETGRYIAQGVRP